MATFHIHQDPEKENAVHAVQDKVRNMQNAKDRRPTFAVLNNVPMGPRVQHGKATALREIKAGKNQPKVKDVRDENYGYSGKSAVQQTAHVPVEQFKSFSVYEDDPVEKKCGESANISIGAIRVPLKEVSTGDGFAQTPMSLGEAPSPMSIDRSSHLEEIENNKPLIPVTPVRSMRERIFDVEEYQMNILEYYRELERKFRPKSTYMQKQPDINYSMRAILVDWLVEVAEEYRLQNETLCLAVSYVDRFLSFMSVVRVKLQLVGTAAMFVAAKYEEIYPPDVGEFVYITDDTYTKTQVLRMEQVLLKTLSFTLCVPTTVAFISTYSVLMEIPDQLKHLATYLCELSLLEGEPYLRYLPSQVSTAALALARHILEMPMWCSKLEEVTLYSLASVKEVILNLCRTHNLSTSMSQQAIQEKYKSSKYMQVSTIPPVQLSEEQFDCVLKEYEAKAVANENVRKMISSLIFV
ncbi:unnamed protein product [Hermetia illucens]|uniref:Cyclin A n=1 Tax=Hermetia illucens TaxID=343691 RepID=A0A7R8UHP0_HERIL|nr:G2/mitotic-specific cyclin-A [Hermetia illucens]CAD7080981.1 unnamed protein product [Hermetia illucens]